MKTKGIETGPIYNCRGRNIVILNLDGKRQAFYQSAEDQQQWFPLEGVEPSYGLSVNFTNNYNYGGNYPNADLLGYGTPRLQETCKKLDALQIPPSSGKPVAPEFINASIGTKYCLNINAYWKTRGGSKESKQGLPISTPPPPQGIGARARTIIQKFLGNGQSIKT